jgi:hypothetical protein
MEIYDPIEEGFEIVDECETRYIRQESWKPIQYKECLVIYCKTFNFQLIKSRNDILCSNKGINCAKHGWYYNSTECCDKNHDRIMDVTGKISPKICRTASFNCDTASRVTGNLDFLDWKRYLLSVFYKGKYYERWVVMYARHNDAEYIRPCTEVKKCKERFTCLVQFGYHTQLYSKVFGCSDTFDDIKKDMTVKVTGLII